MIVRKKKGPMLDLRLRRESTTQRNRRGGVRKGTKSTETTHD